MGFPDPTGLDVLLLTGMLMVDSVQRKTIDSAPGLRTIADLVSYVHCIQVDLCPKLLCVPREPPLLEVVWIQSSSAACILTARCPQEGKPDGARELYGFQSIGQSFSICIDCMDMLHSAVAWP